MSSRIAADARLRSDIRVVDLVDRARRVRAAAPARRRAWSAVRAGAAVTPLAKPGVAGSAAAATPAARLREPEVAAATPGPASSATRAAARGAAARGAAARARDRRRGAGTGGAGTGTGGAVCPPPLSQFGCRATYDEQVASGICLSSGLITYGPCGSGWDWHCSSIWSDDCLYDANKSLLGAKHCDDAPNRFCSMCYQSSGYMTDGGPACSTGTLGD